jgi:hypothetical protein
MKTLLGTILPENTRGVVYLCVFDYAKMKISVTKELICSTSFLALTLYAEIPNPESQVAMGCTFEELIIELEELHKNMENPIWLKELSEQL